jgi:asparagine synthase (glutamine-hydrolysing)
MCGIAGLIEEGLPAAEAGAAAERMTRTLVHRGPDGEGFFSAAGVGLGMRRLAIIDIAGGRQPFAGEDGAVQAVFNGEIYNHGELRADLERRGHVFRSRSDGEVIPHLYEEKGLEFVRDLRGMFAIALWDQGRRRLVLARDRLGKKPLFHARLGERVLFGSEIKALLAADPRLAEADPEALVPYFRFGFVPEPGTMFRQVRKLPAAHLLVHERGESRLERYWDFPFAEVCEERSPEEWREGLDALLAEAVRVRLESDVPLGILLSGGLDSSTIVAYAHRASSSRLRTFTIGFDRPAWDESADAAAVAARFGTEHHVLRLEERELASHLPETVLMLARQFDEPFGDSSALPTYHVSRLARQHATVVLSGDGGDELFAGYSSYRGMRFAESYRRLGAWLGGKALPALARSSAHVLPRGARYRARRVAKVLADSALPFEDAYFSKMAVSGWDVLGRFLTPEVLGRVDGSGDAALAPRVREALRSGLPVPSAMSLADFRFRLLDDMLVKVDRTSMAHSLEVRCPLLDHRLVEFVARMPPGLKLRGWQSKAILRDTVRGVLPAATLGKRKQGFSLPLRDWLRTSLDEMAGDYLDGGSRRLPAGVFDRAGIASLLAEHRRGTADHSPAIWSLLSFAAWHQVCGQSTSLPALNPSPRG